MTWTSIYIIVVLLKSQNYKCMITLVACRRTSMTCALMTTASARWSISETRPQYWPIVGGVLLSASHHYCPCKKKENCWRFIKSSGVSCGFKEGCLSFDMGSLSLPGHWFGASLVECCFFLYKLVFCLSLPDRHHHQQCEHLPVPDRGHGSGVVRQGLARSAKRWHEETNLPARDSHPGSFYICFQNQQPLHIYLDLHELLAQWVIDRDVACCGKPVLICRICWLSICRICCKSKKIAAVAVWWKQFSREKRLPPWIINSCPRLCQEHLSEIASLGF